MYFNLFFRERRLTILLILLISVAGLSSFNSLPRQEDPELAKRWASIKTALPGADAERVEALISEKIESKVHEISEIKRISSRSIAGHSLISLQLEDHVTAVDDVWARVRSKIDDAKIELPKDSGDPDFQITTTAAETLLVAFSWQLDTPIQLDLVWRLARELESILAILPGTKETDVYGEPVEEILISVDAASLAAANLTIGDIASLIGKADPKVSSGQVQGSRTSFVLEMGGAFESLERIRQIPLRTGVDGFVLRVSGIANVERVARQPAKTMTLVDGKRGIIVTAKMQPGQRIDRWAKLAKRKISAFKETVPVGIGIDIIFDQSIHTENRLTSLANNLLLGAGIVVFVLFIMMGWRSSLIVSTALPLTLLMVLPLFKLLGVPLHQISITGLIIALGLLIDNAIVAVDEYNQARKHGHAPGNAISETVRHLAVPLIASTATTILTFLPLVIMPGNAGEFVSTLGIGVILSIVCSLFLALTVVPSLAGYIDAKWPARPDATGFWHHGIRIRKLSGWFRVSVRSSIKFPKLGVLCAIVLPIAGFVLSTQLVDQLFPPVDRNQFMLQLKLPRQTSIDETLRIAEKARVILHAHSEVVRSQWFIGEKPPRVYYNTTISEDQSPRFASAFVDTLSSEATAALLPGLQKEMANAIPEAFILTLPFEQGPPIESPIAVRIFGPEISTLATLGDEIRLILSHTLAVTFTEATVTSGRPKLLLQPDEDKARVAGFSLSELAENLNAALEGVTGGTILEGTEEIPVRVRVASKERSTVSRVAVSGLTIPESATEGEESTLPSVPLNVIAKLELVPAVGNITHRHGQRVNTVRAYLKPFSLTGLSFKDFRKRLAESNFKLPPGYRLEFGGESEGSGDARANLLSVFAPLLVLMVCTLVLAFNSFRMASIIFMVAILSVGCGLASVWVFDYPIGFLAIIGTMGLIGIAINDSIVVLAAIRADEVAKAGHVDAMVNVVMAASRHIISTTLTTIGGFLPLIIWGGVFWPPLAIAVAGGMIGATILALFFVPPMYILVNRIGAKRRARRNAAAAAVVGTTD